MISESEIEFKELSLEEEKLNSDIDNEEILKNQAIKKSIKVSPRKMFDSGAFSGNKTRRCPEPNQVETTFLDSRKSTFLG